MRTWLTVAGMSALIAFQSDKSRLEQELARPSNDAETKAALDACQKAQAALEENIKAQMEAGGDAEKLGKLQAQDKDLETAYWKVRNAVGFARNAVDMRKLGLNLPVPPVVNDDVLASREKYATAINRLADFYAEKAKNPPEGRMGLPTEGQAEENALKLARDLAKVEFDYQIGIAPLKANAAQFVNYPTVKTAFEGVIEKATALRDAQLKAVEAQNAVQKATVARRQADEAFTAAIDKDRAAIKARGAQQ